ncbi:MAG: hypothetical protein QNK37_15805 [Acidobacteriota bacterium]|nr:hypothetical protein [Acidobacteriota bacterium]
MHKYLMSGFKRFGCFVLLSAVAAPLIAQVHKMPKAPKSMVNGRELVSKRFNFSVKAPRGWTWHRDTSRPNTWATTKGEGEPFMQVHVSTKYRGELSPNELADFLTNIKNSRFNLEFEPSKDPGPGAQQVVYNMKFGKRNVTNKAVIYPAIGKTMLFQVSAPDGSVPDEFDNFVVSFQDLGEPRFSNFGLHGYMVSLAVFLAGLGLWLVAWVGSLLINWIARRTVVNAPKYAFFLIMAGTLTVLFYAFYALEASYLELGVTLIAGLVPLVLCNLTAVYLGRSIAVEEVDFINHPGPKGVPKHLKRKLKKARSLGNRKSSTMDHQERWWDAAVAAGSTKDMVRSGVQLIGSATVTGQWNEAVHCWERLHREVGGQPVPFELSLKLAEALHLHGLKDACSMVVGDMAVNPARLKKKDAYKLLNLAVETNGQAANRVIDSLETLKLDPKEQAHLKLQRQSIVPGDNRIELSEKLQDPTVEEESNLEIISARLTGVLEDDLQLATNDGGKRSLAFHQITNVVAGVIRAEGSKPYLIMDLALDELNAPLPTHRVFRIDSRHSNAASLLRNAPPRDAWKHLAALILQKSRADALPTREAVMGSPYSAYKSPDHFKELVYPKPARQQMKQGMDFSQGLI